MIETGKSLHPIVDIAIDNVKRPFTVYSFCRCIAEDPGEQITSYIASSSE